MGTSTLLERLDQGVIDAAHEQISHGPITASIAMLFKAAPLVGDGRQPNGQFRKESLLRASPV